MQSSSEASSGVQRRMKKRRKSGRRNCFGTLNGGENWSYRSRDWSTWRGTKASGSSLNPYRRRDLIPSQNSLTFLTFQNKNRKTNTEQNTSSLARNQRVQEPDCHQISDVGIIIEHDFEGACVTGHGREEVNRDGRVAGFMFD